MFLLLILGRLHHRDGPPPKSRHAFGLSGLEIRPVAVYCFIFLAFLKGFAHEQPIFFDIMLMAHSVTHVN